MRVFIPLVLTSIILFFSPMSAFAAVEDAVLAGGCFWCTEAIFSRLKGVNDVYPGYTGGGVANPKYKQVCLGITGHAEAVEILYDQSIISYKTLLEVFFSTHNPTTLNRQGNDIGSQYRSCLLYTSPSPRDRTRSRMPSSA